MNNSKHQKKIVLSKNLIIFSYIFLLLFFLISSYYFPLFHISLTFEDLYLEWVHFYLTLSTSLLSLLLFFCISQKYRFERYFLLIFSISFLFISLEEISWGQRLLNYKSPDFFVNYNNQKEVDFHNIIGRLYDINPLLNTSFLYASAIFVYGVISPLLIGVTKTTTLIYRRFNFIFPPKLLTIGFLLGTGQIFFTNISEFYIFEESELFIYLSFFYFILLKFKECSSKIYLETKFINSYKINSLTTFLLILLIIFMSVITTLFTDWRNSPFGHGVDYYHFGYAIAYSERGYFDEAVKQYETALRIRNNIELHKDYRFFLYNLDKAEIKPNKKLVGITFLEIDNLPSIVIHQYPSSYITYNLHVPYNTALSFNIALPPESWNPNKGDGVLFEIYAKDKQNSVKIFSKYIDPKNREEDRTWHEVVVNLSKYGGEKIKLTFVTLPGPKNNSDYDWAVWGNIKFIKYY